MANNIKGLIMFNIGTQESTMEKNQFDHAFKGKMNEMLRIMTQEIHNRNPGSSLRRPVNRETVIKRIYNIMSYVKHSLESNQTPCIKYPNFIWANCHFGERINLGKLDGNDLKCSKIERKKEILLLIKVLAKILKLFIYKSTISEREFYYQNLHLFRTRTKVIDIISKLCCILDVPQWELGILSSSEGLVAGSLSIQSKSGSIVICSNEGATLIPQDLPFGVTLSSSAKFVLIVEKDAIFKKLLNEQFLKFHGPCILITGKGFPDMNTRLLVKFISDQLSIPIFALMDADPFGIEIMCTYRFGSMKKVNFSDIFAVPTIKWIGIHPSDIPNFFPKAERLSPRDVIKAHQLLEKPFIAKNEGLSSEVKLMIHHGLKSEIEGIGSISNSYLTDVYIPIKICSNQII